MFKYQDEFIATPSHNAGIITLPPSYLKLGGRYFKTASLQVTLPTLTANTLYFVYCRVVASVATLFIDTSVPSSYRNSFPTAKLVTAFYSNGLVVVAFGSFVNITGVPRSNTWQTTPSGSWLVNTNWLGQLSRNGEMCDMALAASTVGAPTAVQLFFNFPANLLLDTTKTSVISTAGNMGKDSAYVYDAGPGNVYEGLTVVLNSAIAQPPIYPYIDSGSNMVGITQAAPITFGNGDFARSEIKLPILGWSNTQLVDL